MGSKRKMRYRLVYNPEAGDTTFKNKLDMVLGKFQKEGIQIVPYRTFGPEDIKKGIDEIEEGEYQGVLVSGGDGTLNHAVNALLNNSLDLPLGIFPSGTANDFAVSLKIPKNTSDVCDMILEDNRKRVDVGLVNGQYYFANVASGGLLSEIAHTVDIDLKHSLGKIAYYLKGFGQLPKFKPFPLELKIKEGTFRSDVLLFLVANSKTGGGFKNLAPRAKVDDGLLDVMVFKSCSIAEFIPLFVKLWQGEHVKSVHVEYFQTKELEIYSDFLEKAELDGELGPKLPLKIEVVPKKLEVWVP